MKQNIKKYILYLLPLNFILSLILVSMITAFTSERVTKQLILEINSGDKYIDIVKEKFFFTTSFQAPQDYLRDLDQQIRVFKTINDLNNTCYNVVKLKGLLPISFVRNHNGVTIDITGNNIENINLCSDFIIKQVNIYNKTVRDRYIENYNLISETFNLNSKDTDENLIDVIEMSDSLNNLLVSLLKSELLSLGINDNDLIKLDNNKLDLEYLKDIHMTYMMSADIKKRMQSSYGKVKRDQFLSIISKIEMLLISGESTQITPKPSNLIIFISTFTLICFLYFLSILVFNKNTFDKKIFKKIFN